jgi:Cu-Zn family superoxide dismutase
MPSNPAMGIKGTVDVFDSGNNRTRFVLMVSGLPPNMTFGSHVHVLSCAEMEAGGHYQHMLPPDGGTAASVANPANEVWLDFTTNSAGNGNSMATVDWRPRAGQAKSVVVHAMQTADGGTAGTKLACTNISL